MAIADTNKNKNIDQLNSFLRGEISAVETYRLALERLASDSPARPQLDAVMTSHARRVNTLRDRIRNLGGHPSENSGPWGTLVKAVETGAKVLGDRVVIAVLEQGEDHGLNDYISDMNKLDPEARDLVSNELLPQQEETHRTMSTLKKQQRKA
jgi:bacterioferritin (cytochrome b1)